MNVESTPRKGNRIGDAADVKARQISTGSCRIYRLHLRNRGGATVYFQIFDSPTTPAENAVPSYPDLPLGAGQTASIDTPFTFSTGCYICASSSDGTKTLVGSDSVAIVAEI